MNTSMIDTLSQGSALYIDSREVAEMVEKDHAKLLKDIRRYTEQFGQAKIGSSDFWTESTYQNSQNKTQPCYLITKKGCEFIAHKMTGAKGTVFTARYIERFHEMEETLKTGMTTTGQSGLVPAEQILPVLTDITKKLDCSLQRQEAFIQKQEAFIQKQEAFIQKQNETNVMLVDLLVQISSHLEELTFKMR